MVIHANTRQQSRVWMTQPEHAGKQRARENEYWRQRTLARQKQVQGYQQTDGAVQAQDGDGQSLESMDPSHRIGELLNYFMDEYNRRKLRQPFLNWVDSMTPDEQLALLQKAIDSQGCGAVVKPEWVRAFRRGCRHLYAFF